MRRQVILGVLVLLALAAKNAWAIVPYVVTDLGAPRTSSSEAIAVNNSGQVVGENDGGCFLYSNGTMQEIAALRPSGLPSYPQYVYSVCGLNDSGQITGTYSYNNGSGNPPAVCPYIYSNGTVQYVGPTPNIYSVNPTWVVPTGINDSGQIIGGEGYFFPLLII